jgi:hypothetical protein
MEVIEFAFDALGADAYDYLHSRYPGDDPRLDDALLRQPH